LRKEIPHHLVDSVSPAENFDANRFLTLADEAIADITRRGKKVLVIGGTGMYLRMLLKGHCEAPGRDEEIRKELRERIEKEGLASLYRDLRKIDLPSAKTIHPNDPIRIVRALEVWKLTGIPLSEFHERHHFQENRYMALQIGLNVDREILYANINARVDIMMEQGWFQEVQNLLQKYSEKIQPMRSLGYRELALAFQKKVSLEEAINQIKKKTRHFAKRQLTWFRSDPSILWYPPDPKRSIEMEIKNFFGGSDV